MKNLLDKYVAPLALALSLAVSGCSTIAPKDSADPVQAEQDRQEHTRRLLEALIVTGVRYDLVENPQHRVAYVRAKNTAITAAASKNWDVPKLLEAISAAAPEVFQDGRAALYLQGGIAGLQLVELVSGRTVRFNSPVYAQIFVEAAASGLTRALQ